MKCTATYSPEDNKLRLYVGRVPRAEYEELRAAGFVSTPKQDCDFVATWTPAREDLAMSYLEEGEDIGDEDYSPEERAADRAERFSGYRDKRLGEATGHAETFEAGPSAFGHQSQARAERQARRHDRSRTRAVSQWSKAEYWQQRTAGVIRHALHKSSAHVRRGRILRLESEQRKHLENVKENQRRYNLWKEISTMEGADEVIPENREGMNKAQRLAYELANYGSHLALFHPTNEAANAKNREIHKAMSGFSLHDLLTRTEFVGVPMEPMTPRQVAALYMAKVRDPSDEDHSRNRWSRHYELRLEYENAMLAEEGGKVAEVDIEPGGWILIGRGAWQIRGAQGQWLQVQKVNKSPATKRVTSVAVLAPTCLDYDKKGNPWGPDNPRPMALHNINIERWGEDSYRQPTDAERAQFAEQKKASKKPPVSTINPTDADAERLQAILNSRTTSPPRPVDRLTQEKYSRYSGGDGMYYICQFSAGDVVFKCRMRRRGFTDYKAAESVVVLTDKPQKPIPAAYWKATEKSAEPKEQKQVAFA